MDDDIKKLFAKYIELDDKLSAINDAKKKLDEKIKIIKNTRDPIASKLTNYMIENNMSTNTIRFNSTEGLSLHESIRSDSISIKFLHNIFIQYFEDVDTADKLISFIKENRGQKKIIDLQRKQLQ